jgi:hypothetical protein
MPPLIAASGAVSRNGTIWDAVLLVWLRPPPRLMGHSIAGGKRSWSKALLFREHLRGDVEAKMARRLHQQLWQREHNVSQQAQARVCQETILAR